MIVDRNARAELAALQRENTALTPEAILEQARSSNSALHGYFTWDDTRAAHLYRLQQAKKLLRVVVSVSHPRGPRVSQVVVREEPRPAPAKPSAAPSTAPNYVENLTSAQVLRRILADINELRSRYEKYPVAEQVFTGIFALVGTAAQSLPENSAKVSAASKSSTPEAPLSRSKAAAIVSALTKSQKQTFLWFPADGSVRPVSGPGMSLLIKQLWNLFPHTDMIALSGEVGKEEGRLLPMGKLVRGVLLEKEK